MTTRALLGMGKLYPFNGLLCGDFSIPAFFDFQELLCSIPPESILQNHSLNSTQPIIIRKKAVGREKKEKIRLDVYQVL